MACKGCGPSAGPVPFVRTFTFPLGTSGEVDLIVRGDVTKEDISGYLQPAIGFAETTLLALSPTRAEQAQRATYAHNLTPRALGTGATDG